MLESDYLPNDPSFKQYMSTIQELLELSLDVNGDLEEIRNSFSGMSSEFEWNQKGSEYFTNHEEAMLNSSSKCNF